MTESKKIYNPLGLFKCTYFLDLIGEKWEKMSEKYV